MTLYLAIVAVVCLLMLAPLKSAFMANWGFNLMIMAALFPSIVAYFCWNLGVAVIGANRTGLFINLIPVFSAILAILFLGESLKSFHLAGMALILVGLVMFNR